MIRFGMLSALAVVVAAQPARAEEEDGRLGIVVTNIRLSETIPSELVATLTNAVSEELNNTGGFKSISSQDVQQMLGLEQAKQLLGCESDTSCLAEIGGAMGSDLLLTGSVLLVKEAYLIQMQLVRISPAGVEKRVSREYQGGPLGLVEELRVVAQLVVRDLLSQRSGKLLVRVSEEGAAIKIDDQIIGVAPLAGSVSVAQGMHTLEVEKDGFVRFSRTVRINKDEGAFLEVALRPSQDFIDDYEGNARLWQIGAWSAVGVGAAAIIGGVVAIGAGAGKADELVSATEAYNAKANRTQAEFDDIDALRREAGTLDGFGLGAILGGVLLTAAGITTVILSPDPDRYESSVTVGDEAAPAAALGLNIGPTGLFLTGSF